MNASACAVARGATREGDDRLPDTAGWNEHDAGQVRCPRRAVGDGSSHRNRPDHPSCSRQSHSVSCPSIARNGTTSPVPQYGHRGFGGGPYRSKRPCVVVVLVVRRAVAVGMVGSMTPVDTAVAGSHLRLPPVPKIGRAQISNPPCPIFEAVPTFPKHSTAYPPCPKFPRFARRPRRADRKLPRIEDFRPPDMGRVVLHVRVGRVVRRRTTSTRTSTR